MQASESDYKPEFTNLVQLLRTALERYADRPLFGVPRDGGWDWISYTEFGKLVDAFRAGVASLGVGPGDRVAVISNNRLEWAVGAHATYSLSAAYVPMYEAQLDREWQYILADSGAKVCLVASAAVRDRVEKLKSTLPALEHIVTFDGDSSDPRSYAARLAHGAKHPAAPITPADKDIACLIYTSGTTGNPKGVKLSHYNLASNVSAMLSAAGISDNDRGIAFLPWAHVFGGCVELHSAIATGSATAICGDPMKLAEYMPQVKPTILFAVPRVYNKIYAGIQQKMAAQSSAIQWIFRTAMQGKNKKRAGQPLSLSERFAVATAQKVVFPKILEAFGGNLRYACSGAAALSREVAEFMNNLGIEVYEGYGMTESSGCTTANPRGAARLGSVGKPIPGVWVEIDKNAPGSTDRDGEIVIHGMGVMQGYHKLDDVTRDALTPKRGLRSGDLGHLDEDGYLYITGRVKELYKLENGKYVAPAPLEEKLQLSPYIAQCVIYGDNKPHNVALIVPDLAALKTWAQAQGITAEGEELLSHASVRSLLEDEVEKYSKDFKGFERPKELVIDGDELSIANGMLTPTLKLKRRQVVQKYGPIFDSLYPGAKSDRAVPKASYIRELRQPQAAAKSA
jgi:long-chain acyl-CoA synthetase